MCVGVGIRPVRVRPGIRPERQHGARPRQGQRPGPYPTQAPVRQGLEAINDSTEGRRVEHVSGMVVVSLIPDLCTQDRQKILPRADYPGVGRRQFRESLQRCLHRGAHQRIRERMSPGGDGDTGSTRLQSTQSKWAS